jgi:phenylpropionate dioxygenase-like ring-hydroxylating dioxygenase large terminal subunit
VDGGVSILRLDRAPLLGDVRYGFVWVCLGTPARPIIAIPEMDGEAKCIVSGGAIAVQTSAGRVIENFLDLAHLGYVHAGYLGAEPRTAVENYTVRRLPDGGVQATGCRAFQPLELQAARGDVVEYSYKVERPLIASFDKSDLGGRRFVSMYIFAQPVDEEHTVAHTLALVLDEGFGAAEVRAVMQFIFLQDKPILENQHPKRLPIGPLMEMPMMADKTSIAYRRWLAELGLTYGTIRARKEAAA